jgi:hypothetical protein
MSKKVHAMHSKWDACTTIALICVKLISACASSMKLPNTMGLHSSDRQNVVVEQSELPKMTPPAPYLPNAVRNRAITNIGERLKQTGCINLQKSRRSSTHLCGGQCMNTLWQKWLEAHNTSTMMTSLIAHLMVLLASS